MEIRAAQPGDEGAWERQHGEALAFAQKYGAGRISPAAFRALLKLSPRDLSQPGSSLLLARIHAEDGERLAAVCCVTDYGRGLCLVVVHPLYRGRGLGSRLLSEQLALLGRLSCRVALGHVSSLQMCFRAGLYASGLIHAPGGKPVLLLEKSLASPESEESAAHFSKEGDLFATPRPGHLDFISQ
ncbi:N-acetyltransferase family protein [Paenibacillus macerans]|uniref:GNAT family N-acetyltransferase n=1 Tax=Paenibacillus macerans TaxID=44252 RepID=UPI003D30F2B1